MNMHRLVDAVKVPRFLLLQKLLRHIPCRPLDVGRLCFLRLEGAPEVPARLLRGNGQVRAATKDDVDALARLQDKRAMFLERFAAGDTCIIAEVNGQVVGYEWFCDQSVHHEAEWGLPIEIPAGFVYAYDAYIDPAYRNTGLWLRFKAFLSDWMRARGKRGVLTFVDYGNWASLRTHVRFGFSPSSTVLALKVLGITVFKTMEAIVMPLWVSLVAIRLYPAIHHVLPRLALHWR